MNRSKWEYKKLSDVSDITMGQSPSSDSYNEDGNGLPFYQGNADFGELYPTARVYCDAPSREADSDDILMSVRAPIGAINIANEHCCIGRGLCAIRPIPKVSDKMFLFYYLRAKNAFLNLQGTGSTFKSISKKVVYDLNILMPPFADQQRIVAELDCLNEMIAVKQEQLKEFDKLAQSIFYDMFGDPSNNDKKWIKKDLKTVCLKITDGTHDTPQRLNAGIKFITGKHIRPFYIDYDNSDYVTEEVHKEIYQRCNPEFGDVLYTNIGAGIGNAAINIVDYEFSMKNVALLKPNKEIINGYYIEFYLNNQKIKDRIIEIFANGGAQSFLSLKSISRIPIILPPLALQQQFADKISAIEAQKELVKQSIAETQALLDYTMDYYFNE